MDPRRAQTERNMLPAVGPSFFREGDTVMFQFVMDSSNVLGPRPAKRADQESHPGAWAQFVAAGGVSPLDRDASGDVGGSLPQESPEPVAVQSADPKVDEQDYQPGDLGGGPAMADQPAPKVKRKYTRRTGG